MSKRAKVEAWAVVDFENNITGGPSQDKAHIIELAKMFPEDGERIALLVEAHPAAERVLKAALKLVSGMSPYGYDGPRTEDLKIAVAAYEKSLRKKR